MMIGKLIHIPYSMRVHVPGREELELKAIGKILSVELDGLEQAGSMFICLI